MTSVLLSALERKRPLIFCMHRNKSPPLPHHQSFNGEGNKGAGFKPRNLFASKGLPCRLPALLRARDPRTRESIPRRQPSRPFSSLLFASFLIPSLLASNIFLPRFDSFFANALGRDELPFRISRTLSNERASYEQHSRAIFHRDNKETAVCLLYYIALREPTTVTSVIIPAYTMLELRSGNFYYYTPPNVPPSAVVAGAWILFKRPFLRVSINKLLILSNVLSYAALFPNDACIADESSDGKPGFARRERDRCFSR